MPAFVAFAQSGRVCRQHGRVEHRIQDALLRGVRDEYTISINDVACRPPKPSRCSAD